MKAHVAFLGLCVAATTQIAAWAQTGTVWGVNSATQVWRWDGRWTFMTSGMKQVSVAPDGGVWALDSGGRPTSWNGSAWQVIPGQILVQVSAESERSVWGITPLNEIRRYDGAQWKAIPGNMAQVAAAADGSVWALDKYNVIYFWTGAVWQTISGRLAQISAASARNVWGVNATGDVWQWNGERWSSRPGPMKQVSVAPDGTAWALDNAGAIYSWTGSAWLSATGQLMQLSAALPGRVEENNAAMKFTGSWTRRSDAAASGGGYMVSNVEGNTLTYTFNGDSVAINRLLDPNGGEATVTLDGQDYGVVSFQFTQSRHKVPAVLDRLGSGQHTMVLTVRKPAASTGSAVYIDFISAPAPFLPGADQLAGLTRTNYHRSLAGLPRGSLSTAINLAAQSHADYNGRAGVSGHTQTVGAAGYIGTNFTDRLRYFGYDTPGSEDALQGDQVTSEDAVDTWMSTVYHRLPILAYSITDFGFGLSRLSSSYNMAVMDMGAKYGTSPPDRLLTKYPASGQMNVPTSFTGGEIPEPLPGRMYPVGYPISLHMTHQPGVQSVTNTTPNSAELFDSTGASVPIYFLDKAGDPNRFLNADQFFVVPQKPLKTSEQYRVRIKGKDSRGIAFDEIWTFNTVPAAALSKVQAFSIDATGAWIRWDSAGPTSSVWVEYGATPALGSRANASAGTAKVAYIGGLTPNTTYYFRVNSEDAAGNTWASLVSAFVTKECTELPERPRVASQIRCGSGPGQPSSSPAITGWLEVGDHDIASAAVRAGE